MEYIPHRFQPCTSSSTRCLETNARQTPFTIYSKIPKLFTHYPLPSGLFRDNLQHCVEDFVRLLVAQFTINKVMSNECPPLYWLPKRSISIKEDFSMRGSSLNQISYYPPPPPPPLPRGLLCMGLLPGCVWRSLPRSRF